MGLSVTSVLALWLSTARPIATQPHGYLRPFSVSERPAAGLFVAAASNGNDWSGGGPGADLGAVFEVPVQADARLRFEATHTSWESRNVDYQGEVTAADHVALTTVRVSVIKVRHQLRSLTSYTGLGIGAYRYAFARTPLTRHWRGGVHGVAGLEFGRADGRRVIDTEIRFIAANGPRVKPLWASIVFKGDIAIGAKLRF